MSAKYGKIFFYFVVFFFAQCALAAVGTTPLPGHLDGKTYVDITPSGGFNAGNYWTSLSANVRSLVGSAGAKVSDLAVAVTPAPLTGGNQAWYGQNTGGSTSESPAHRGDGAMKFTSKTDPSSYTVGGTVSGLAPGQSVTLGSNGGGSSLVNADGAFTLPNPFPDGSSYAVSVDTQPTGQTCTVADGSGTVTANVTNITVSCSYSYAATATLTGLAPGQTVTVSGAGTVQLTANGTFTFPQKVSNGSSYGASVTTQPTAQTCTASGTTTVVFGSYAGSTQVVCRSTVGGTISGWQGPPLTLLMNGGDSVQVNGNGAFTFPTQFTPGTPYTVSLVQGDTNCTVSNASGTVTTNVTNVTVNCSYTYPASATLTGLAPGQTVTVSGAGTVQLTANGTFTFPQKVSNGSSYGASVTTQPTAQTCTASGTTAVFFGTYAGNTQVICQSSVGGTVSGLAPGQSVTLASSSAGNKIVGTNGAFTFPTSLTPGTSYTVSVATQPTGQTCAVGNGSGTVTTNVTSVAVVCGSTLGGTVFGLAPGQSATLMNNGGDAKVVNTNGAFAFSAPLAASTAYSVTVGTQPTDQTCTVGNASGVITADITTVTVSCVSTYNIGGTVAGVAPGQSVTLSANGAGTKLMNANGPFAFPTSLTSGTSYSVSVVTQPTAQTCAVAHGSGTATTHVTNVTVTCTASQPAPIPTLSEWGIFLMSSLVALFGIRRMQHQ